ncbi:MAG: hypothetical protein HY291_17830 [Planctomycetes bacterium]|nr:hypothetical protein [Planctomycetota bacterium]
MSKRATKTRVREIWRRMFEDIPEDDGALQAARVRTLCPCQSEWEVPLWDIVFAACQDPCHLVRIEALHVIEDAFTGGHLKNRQGMHLLFKARNDPHPEVRRFVEDTLSVQPKLVALRRREFEARKSRRVRGTRACRGLPLARMESEALD